MRVGYVNNKTSFGMNGFDTRGASENLAEIANKAYDRIIRAGGCNDDCEISGTRRRARVSVAGVRQMRKGEQGSLNIDEMKAIRDPKDLPLQMVRGVVSGPVRNPDDLIQLVRKAYKTRKPISLQNVLGCLKTFKAYANGKLKRAA